MIKSLWHVQRFPKLFFYTIFFCLWLMSLTVFAYEPLLLSVDLNGQRLKTITLGYYDKKTDQLYLPEKKLIEWAVKKPSHVPLIINQNRYYQLNWYRGVKYTIDRQSLTLSVL